MSRRKIVALLVLAAFVGLFVPFDHRVCPDWDVVVVDEQQRPLGGMTVRLIYQDYSLESRSHEEMRTTDARGHASFEQRSIRSTAASHIVGSIRSFAHTGFHASYGRDAYIVVFGKGRRGDFASWDTWSGWSASMHSTIKTIPDTAIR